MAMRKKKAERYTIYVGLADRNEYEQKVSFEKASSLVSNVCRNYNMSFSLVLQQGGYFHHNGQFVDETSLAVSLINAEQCLVDEVASDLCCFFNQESVMVTCEKIRVYSVENNIDLNETDLKP